MGEFADCDSLITLFKLNQQYLAGESDIHASRTFEMAKDISNILKENVEGFRGCFSIGFPFYSVNKSGELISNPEFMDCTERFIKKVELVKALGYTAWECSACQDQNSVHRDVCRDCVVSRIKPREVLKVLPDIDLFVITDDISELTLKRIQDIATDHTFHQSDHNVKDALQRVNQVFSSFNEEVENKVFFPTDIHVISYDGFDEILREISSGNVDPNTEIHSMYYDWKLNNDICLWFDFVFSGTFDPNVCDPIIIEKVMATRRELVKKYNVQDILSLVRTKSQRADVLLKHKPTLDIFIERIESWQTA